MSSRNAYLSKEDRERALGLSRGLRRAHQAFTKGERNPRALEDAARQDVERAADRIDYVSVLGADDLESLSVTPERALLAIACHIGKTRLIDNMVLGEDPAP